MYIRCVICLLVTCQQSGNRCVIPWPLVLLQVEATGLECGPDGDIQRGVQCIISAGAVRGMQTERGAPLLTFSGIREPSPGAPYSETHRHALCHQDLFSRRKEALHPLLCPWVRCREMFFHFHCHVYHVSKENSNRFSLNMNKCFCQKCSLGLLEYYIRIMLY